MSNTYTDELTRGQPLATYVGADAQEQNPDRERNTNLQSAADSPSHSRPATFAPPVPAESSVQVCFRISDIPLAWDDRRTLNVLAEECSTERTTDIQLTLYPSIIGRSQVGILKIVGPQEYVNVFAPLSHDDPKRLVTSGDYQITIDRHFYGLTPLNRATDGVVADIVAVTGLAGHAYGSWKHKNSGKMWLKDFLPTDLKEQARIMTFGYDTSLSEPSMSTAGMVDLVRDLLQQLKAARRSASNRPLIFIGYSLGCILIAKVLLICKLQEKHNNLLEATCLLVFFGAPHKGFRTEELEQMIDDLQVPGSDRLRELLSQLREHSRYLQEHAELLVNIWKDRKIISFYESLLSPITRKDHKTGKWSRDGELVAMVQSVSSLLYTPDEERIPVRRNHSEIAKFESRSDDKYDTLVTYMEEALKSIEFKNKENAFTDDHMKWRKSLLPSNYEDYRDNLLYKRQKNTCTWLLRDKNFRLWNEDDYNRPVLWINGGPGCGKSVMAAFLSKEIAKTKQLSLAYFFCDDKDERLRTASAVLANWLAQLLKLIPSMVVHFPAELRTEKEKTSWTFEMLWRVFQRIINDTNSGDICLLIDALDECEEESRTNLLKRLEHLMDDGSTKKRRFKLVITSRPHVPIAMYLKDIVRVPIGASNLTNDIAAFVEAEVQKLPPYTENLAQEVKEALIKGANGMFLWVSLVLDDLKKSPTTKPGAIRRKLKSLPKDLPDVYIKILSQIPADSRTEAQNILRWVVWAQRPLTTKELNIATAVGPDSTSMADIEDDMETNMEHTIQRLFGPMLRIDNDGTVHLVHQSARDFFVNMRSDTYNDPSLSVFYIPCAKSNLRISITCIIYLSFDECGKGPVPSFLSYQHGLDIEVRKRELELLDYATRHWPEHTHQACSEMPNQRKPANLPSRELEEVFYRLTESSAKFDLAFQLFCFSCRIEYKRTPPLQVVASFGLLVLIQKLLICGADINAQGGRYGSALIAAAYNGHEKAVRLLADLGADIHAKGDRYGSALQAAALMGRENVIRLLIDLGADVNARGGEYGNVLQAAALKGREDLVRLLIDLGADVNARGGEYGNALQAAASMGRENVVRLLVDLGVNINANEGEYGSALHIAAWNGKEKMVRLLIDLGADVNAKGGQYGSALQAAARNGNDAVVRLLIELGADINAKGGLYGNTLQAAACVGRENIVRLLIDLGANINAKGGLYGNALQAAALMGRENVIRLLISLGADVNAKGGQYGSALQAAAWSGNGPVVRLLIDLGADVNAKGGEYGNALQAAILGGNKEVAQMLLDCGADANTNSSCCVS